MKKLVDRLFADYGAPAQLCAGERSTELRVIFQGVRGKGLQGAERVFVPLGQVSRDMHVCYFPAGAQVQAEDTLVLEGHSYRICRVEPMRGKNGRPLYFWGLCVGKDSE